MMTQILSHWKFFKQYSHAAIVCRLNKPLASDISFGIPKISREWIVYSIITALVTGI